MVGPLGRILAALATLVGVTLLTFLVLAALPGDPLAAFVDPERAGRLSAEERARLETRYGLDGGLPERYLRWVGGVLRGDLGRSMRSDRPVTREIADRLVPTLELNLCATLFALVVGAPLGWWAARRPGGAFDRGSSTLVLALYALPFFWLAILLQHLLAVRWGIVPLAGRTPSVVDPTIGERALHLVLPSFCLGLHMLAFYARFARNTALEGLVALHARVARLAGLRESRVFARDGVQPSLIPLATLFGLLLPALASGSVIVEQLFSWPGIGRLLVQSVANRDVPVVAALTLLAGVLTVAGSLLADLLTWAVDPRRRRPSGVTP